MIIKWVRRLLGDYWIFRLKEIKARIIRSTNAQPKVDTKLYRTFILEGDLCFDIGANVGNKVDALLRSGAKIVAVEPQLNCCRILKYKYGNKISIVQKGVGEAIGIKEFHISESSTISSFSKEWIDSVKKTRFNSISWNKKVDMEMTTLDELIKQYGSPAFIKIDVEGYELEVLKGLTNPIPMISFEYTVPEKINRLFECLEYLKILENEAWCNYTIGESMMLELSQWIKIDELKRHISSGSFPKSEFGDIYVTTTRPKSEQSFYSE